MKIRMKKKLILISVIIFVVIIIGLILYFVFRQETDYTGEPISQESLSANDLQQIDLKDLQIDERGRYKIWGVSNEVSVSAVENMIYNLGLNLSLAESIEGSYYRWEDNSGNYVHYSILDNVVLFNMVSGVDWYEAVLTDNSFSSFAEQYLDAQWEYQVMNTVDFPQGERFYYARRLTPNSFGIERTPNLYQETDYLSLKDGRIMSGKFFLTKFFDTGIEVPLIGIEDLRRYVNEPTYPKSINVRPDQIAEAVGLQEDYSYMNTEIITLQETIDSCKAINYSVVYLYKSFEQTYLTPVYRLALECIIEYETLEYSVPAVGYISAIDPQYIVVPE